MNTDKLIMSCVRTAKLWALKYAYGYDRFSGNTRNRLNGLCRIRQRNEHVRNSYKHNAQRSVGSVLDNAK